MVGGWRLVAARLAAVGGWRLATGGGGVGGGWWWLAAVGGWGLMVDGGWQWLAVGGWSPLAVGGGWRRLAVGGWWRLAVGGGWWLAVDGPLGRSLRAVLNKTKSSSLRTPVVPWVWGGSGGRVPSSPSLSYGVWPFEYFPGLDIGGVCIG